MNYYIKNWETMSALGRYLTAKDTLESEFGMSVRLKKSYSLGEMQLALVVGYVTKNEMMDFKAKFPYIKIVEK